MLNICITFDYELFFGKTKYSPYDVLIIPTDLINELLGKHDVKATFFSDIPMCIKHRSNGFHGIADDIDEQMVNMLSQGHDVQLHIHPFWYKAAFDGSNWVFDNRYYSLNSFEEESYGIKEIMSETTHYLNELLSTKFPSYKCIAYRAGGFCIQPEKNILDAMRNNGIVIDSSVCKRLYADTSSHVYNFSKAPKDFNWRFGYKNGLFTVDKCGEFLEIPIGSEYRIPAKWISVHTCPKLIRGLLKGETSKDTDVRKSEFTMKIEKIKAFFYQGIMMSLDSSHYLALEKMIKNFMSMYDCKSGDFYLAIIGHPKLFTDENYENMDRFLYLIKSKYSETVSFCTITDVYKRVY